MSAPDARTEIEAALADAERTVERLRALLDEMDGDDSSEEVAAGALPPVDLVPAAVAARRLSVTAAAVRAWFARGEIRGDKDGTAIMVSMSDARERRARMRRQPEK